MNISDNLLSKSIESITLAIELYNKPLIKYRTESVIVLIINSWENVLKALIQKNSWAKIYNRKKDESKPFDECIECVKTQLGKKYNDDWYESTILLYKERCKIIHFYKELNVIDYMIIQSNIILFKDFVQSFFGKSIIKDKNWYILPIGTELPYTDFDFIKKTSALKNLHPEIKSYLQKVVDTHSKQIKLYKNKGILVNVKVSLENVKRVKKSDLIVGVDSNFGKTKISLAQRVKLSDQGRSVKIKEITDALKKYKYHHKDVLSAVNKLDGYSMSNFNKFMKDIKANENVSFNWSIFSNVFSMKIYGKYTYAEDIVKEYIKYLNQKK